MKRLTLIVNSKGGVGKSTLTYLLSNIIHRDVLKNVRVADMDNESKSTSKVCAFIKPMQPVIVKGENIDTDLFEKFIDQFAESKQEHVICDFGAESSRFLALWLTNNAEDMAEYMEDLGIELEVVCILSGSTSFDPSIAYMEGVFDSLPESARKTIAINMQLDYTEAMQQTINEVVTTYKCTHFEYTLGKAGSTGTQEIAAMMAQGKPAYLELSGLQKKRFYRSLDELKQTALGLAPEVEA